MTAPGTGLRVVVVGTGFGCVTHVRALRAAGFEVIALVGQDPDRTAWRARACDVAAGLTSLSEALARRPDALTIATPPHTHCPIALEALSAGVHVLCEKPLARDAAEARRMLEAAEQSERVHLVGHEFRFDAGQATLAQAVHNGAIGVPRLVTLLLHVPMLARPGASVPAWWADPLEGGGWLGAHGSQLIDQIRATVGDFVGLSAALPQVGPEMMRADNSFVLHFELAGGAVGILESTVADHGPPLIITRVAGSEGTAWIEGVGATVKVADERGTRVLPVDEDLLAPVEAPPIPEGFVTTAYEQMTAHGLDLVPYTRLAEVFARRIRGDEASGGPEPATFVDGVATMEVLDAARTSAADHSWVAIGR
jgi:predicted dehydrogenase